MPIVEVRFGELFSRKPISEIEFQKLVDFSKLTVESSNKSSKIGKITLGILDEDRPIIRNLPNGEREIFYSYLIDSKQTFIGDLERYRKICCFLEI